MDIWNLINSIGIVVITIVGGLLVNKQLEKIKSKYSKQQFVHQLQFEKEFNIYHELWKKIRELKNKTELWIYSADEVKRKIPDEQEYKVKMEKAGQTVQKYYDEIAGYISDNMSLDLNSNGYLDIGDVPADQDGDFDIDEIDFTLWMDSLVAIGEAVYHDGIWIFDVAVMVISGQTIVNDGTKNFQIRFYPVATTEFGDPR